MNIKYRIVDTVPPRKYHFELGDRTKEVIAILRGIQPGQTVQFPVDPNLPERERLLKTVAIGSRVKTALKHISTGYYRTKRSNYNYYVTRES